MIFQDYAGFYDSLYKEKDYQAECDFVQRVLKIYGQNEIKTILDLGCGTGSHTFILADMGYTVTGVDLSERMLELARSKARAQNKQIDFLKSDIRYLELTQRFDAAVAMFTVLGYQTTNQDVDSALKSVHQHLNPGGLFISDVWFGPAVLKERPDERVKTIEQNDRKITRHAQPFLDILNHTIEVSYTMSEVKQGHAVAEVKESHLVRFFFYQELVNFLERNGFEILKICPFMDLDGQVDEHCWNISVIGRASR